MVYFLGRDVQAVISVEDTTNRIDNASGVATVVAASGYSSALGDIGIRTAIDVTAGTGQISDVTGVDITLGSVDEDIAYLGQNTALKAEIKKETTITITKKKSDAFYSHMWAQGLRWGVNPDTASLSDSVALGLAQPTTLWGFRLHIALKDTAEVISVMGCQFTEYGVSLSADGVQEETMTFISHILPVVGIAEDTSIILATEL